MKSLGIKYQLRLTTLIPIFIVALLFAVFYNGQFNKDLNQHLKRLGQAYIHQLLPTLQLALMKNDHRTLQGLINATTLTPEIKAIAFYDEKGFLIAYRGGKHSIHTPFKPPEFTGDYIESRKVNFYTINFIAPITLPKFNLYSNMPFHSVKDFLPLQADDILGWVSIDIDTKWMLIKRYQMYIITIFITLFGLLISLTIHYFLSKRIYIPILRLRRSMKQILSNEFETHISATSSAELGDIEKGCVHLQKEYLNTMNDLNHHVEIATADLQQSLELLEEKNIELSLEKKKTEERSRQKSEFIANMSHEIRTPMNGVIGFTNVLLESKLDPLQLDYVKTIKSSAQDLLNIITDILDYSKMDAGKLHLDCIPVDLRACLDEVCALTLPNAHKKNIDLIPSVDTELPKTLLGDPLRIKQILTNLISNAIKFTDRGHVLVRTKIDAESDKDYTIAIAVTDTGIGISPDDQSKLFNAFNQADTSITRRFGGTGLGLVICKKLTEAMHGKISLSSEPHRGSTFTIKIKLNKLNNYDNDKPQLTNFNQLTALCFDDNPLYLNAMCTAIEFWGVKCVKINSIDLLEKAFLKHTECKLAFININEGHEQRIASILLKQTMSIVLVSKWLIHHPETLGGKAFLYKPLLSQKIYETIDRFVNEAHYAPTANVEKISTELESLRNQVSLIRPAVLVAEDNPVNRMLIHSLFKEYTAIDSVENGEEAIVACCDKPYDLLIFDLRMPKINGLDVSKRIRNESVLNKFTPIILISANISDISAEEMKLAGIDLCIAKPIDEKQLLAHILKLINQKKVHAIDWPLCVQKVLGNQILAEEFLTRFVEELHKARQNFKQLFNEKNLSGLENEAHKLHGACCFCGVPRLQSQVTRIENLAKSASSPTEFNNAFVELIQSIDEVIDEFDNLYATRS